MKAKQPSDRRTRADRRRKTRNSRRASEDHDNERQLRVTLMIEYLKRQEAKRTWREEPQRGGMLAPGLTTANGVTRCVLCGASTIVTAADGRIVHVVCRTCGATFNVEFEPPDQPELYARIEMVRGRTVLTQKD